MIIISKYRFTIFDIFDIFKMEHSIDDSSIKEKVTYRRKSSSDRKNRLYQ